VISKFLHCTILATTSAKSFFQQKFQFKVDKNPTRPRITVEQSRVCWPCF
jgi:hypothetical protein